MEILPHRHLMTLTLAVDFAAVVAIGAIPAGRRGIAPVTGGRFDGERLRGSVAPGHDWFVTRDDGALIIDVRLTLTTADGAIIYLAYRGRMTGHGDAMARFRKGELLDSSEYSLTVVATFECGDDRYRWLNDVMSVGVGGQTPDGPVYNFYEVGR